MIEKENSEWLDVPSWLAYRERIYPLVTAGVVFVPPYSNIYEFIKVNRGGRAADGVMFMPVLQETEQVFGFRGAGLTWEEMRQFAITHRTVWLASHQAGEFLLRDVGSITPAAAPAPRPLARFENGPVLEAATARKTACGTEWAVELTWLATSSLGGRIFVHVRDF